MSGEKRKAVSAESGRPAKKVQTENIKVTHIIRSDAAKPILATAPGVIIPSDLSFTGFTKKETDGRSTMLLHSSAHPTIDYFATESRATDVAEKHMKHYIGLYDPANHGLKVTEAKKMTVRKNVRVAEQERDANEEEKVPATPSSRAALTQAFGTKKSKKAVAAIAENRLLARNGETDNPVSAAILNSIQEEDDDSDTAMADSTTARVNKPLPLVNTLTNNIAEVYGLKELVHPSHWETTLSEMPIARWKDYVQKNKPIDTKLRFVATCVGYLTAKHLHDPTNALLLQKVQLLRYIQLLVEIHKFIAHQSSRKRMPPVEKWPARTTTDSSLTTNFKAQLVASFFPDNIPTDFRKTLLTSTILALTLHIPPPKFTPGETQTMLFTDPSDITLDLAVPASDIHKLYREMGCKMESLTDAELKKYGWDKLARKVDEETGKAIKAPKPKFAKLRFPIEFPKVSSGRPVGRR